MIRRRILAGGVHTVVTAFAGIGHALMIKHPGGKSVGVMAHAAILGRGNMSGRLAGSKRAVVARGAIAGDAVVSEDRRFKRRGVVAKVAILVRGDMVCRRIFAGGKYTVMTTFARRGNTLEIEYARGKAAGAVAHPAVFGGGNVIYRLTRGKRAVMAAGAIAGDADVSENRWAKRRGGMADVAILCGRYMNGRRILTDGGYTVVTTFTPSGNALMAKCCGNKSTARDVTDTAIFLGRDVGNGLAGGYGTVMAGCAVVDDVHMIERRPRKGAGIGMTHRAVLCGGQVILGKSHTDHAVVTACAATCYTVVIKNAGGKSAGSMAVAAIIASRHMVERLTDCVNSIVAGSAQLVLDTGDGVIETIGPGEGAGVVTHAAIVGDGGMIGYFARRGRAVVTGLTRGRYGAVVENDGEKIIHDVTQVTGIAGDDMSVFLTGGDYTVVANFAILGNACVVITAVRCQFEKSRGIVTVVTFGVGCGVSAGFADGPHTVMAFTAFTKHFQMIDKRGNGKAKRRMTHLTQIAGGHVIR